MKFLDVEKYTPIQKSHEAYLKELMEYCKDTPRHPSYHIHPPCGLVNDRILEENTMCFISGFHLDQNTE